MKAEGQKKTVMGLVGDTSVIDGEQLKANEYVERS